MKINCSHDELVDLHKIILNPKNPNKHPESQIERLAKLIDYQGQRHPIIISKRSGFVVVGHGRYEAIKKLGWKKVAVNYQDFESEDQEYAFVVSDNAIGEWSELDLSFINSELPNFDPSFDIEMFGIKDFTLDPSEKMDADYSALDGLDDITGNLKKGVLIEFEIHDFKEAIELLKYWREKGLCVGTYLLNKLRQEKEKNA